MSVPSFLNDLKVWVENEAAKSLDALGRSFDSVSGGVFSSSLSEMEAARKRCRGEE